MAMTGKLIAKDAACNTSLLIGVKRPQGPKALRPKGPKTHRPKCKKASRPTGPETKKPEGPKAQRPNHQSALCCNLQDEDIKMETAGEVAKLIAKDAACNTSLLISVKGPQGPKA